MALALAALLTASLSACDTESTMGSTTSDRPTPTEWPLPSGEPVTVDTVERLDGADWYQSDGIRFLCPDDWEVTRTDHDDFVQIVVAPADDPDSGVAFGISAGSTPDDIETMQATSYASVSLGGATDIEKMPVIWEGWSYASGMTGTSPTDDGSVVDFTIVSLLSSDTAVSVAVRAPSGTLENSVVYKVARSVQHVES